MLSEGRVVCFSDRFMLFSLCYEPVYSNKSKARTLALYAMSLET